MNDTIICAIIMIGMIVVGLIGVIYSVKHGNSGFISAVRYKEKREEEKDR